MKHGIATEAVIGQAHDQLVTRSTSRRAAAGSFIGTTVEWYDYFIYGTAAALVFPTVFFRDLRAGPATFASLGTFAVAFLLRPLGGVIIGHFGDRIGRKRMLIGTLSAMGIGTGLIGLLPTFADIGYWAPVLLVLLRMVQGFALGGEWGGAALMTTEHAPAGRRGLYGSTMQMGVPAGLLLSTGAFAVVASLPNKDFFAWGWRIPFLLSFCLLGIGMYIRLRVSESPTFQRIEAEGAQPALPIVEVLRDERKKTIVLVLLQSVANVGYFLITVYALTYITKFLHLPRSWAVTGLLLAAAADLVMQPVFGALSDRYGRRKVYAFGAAFLGAYAFPFFALLGSGSEMLVWLALVLGLGVGHASTGSLHGVIYAEQYPTRYRYSGASVAYQLSGIVSSAPTPLIAAWLVDNTGSAMFVAGYVVLAAVITLVCLTQIEETYRVEIDR